LKLKTVQG